MIVDGDTVITGQIFRLQAFVSTQPFASVACIVTLVPLTPLVAAVGVPLSTPAVERLSPAGSVPLLTAHTYGEAPPDAVRAWE